MVFIIFYHTIKEGYIVKLNKTWFIKNKGYCNYRMERSENFYKKKKRPNFVIEIINNNDIRKADQQHS